MSQSLFVVALYLLGINAGLLFRGRLPATFLIISGFLWGATLWVFAVMAYMILGIAVNGLSLSLGLGTVSMLIIIRHAQRGSWRVSRSEWLGGAGMALLLGGVAVLAATYNYAAATPDSINIILFGRLLALDGVTPWVSQRLSSYGIFLPALHAASVLLGDAYLWAIQPTLGIVFALLFGYFSFRTMKRLAANQAVARGLWIGVSVLTLLVGTFFMFFQSVYIHNNFLSGLYLFVAVASFYSAVVEERHEWLVFGVLALVAFSFARTEAPLYSLIFLSIVLAPDQLTYRTRLYATLAYAIPVAVWYAFLFNAIRDSHILNQERIGLILAIIALFAAGMAMTRITWIRDRILPLLPYLMLLTLVLILGVTFVRQPTDLKHATRVTFDNMFFAQWWHETWASNWWGVTWFAVVALAAIAVLLPRIADERLFVVGITGFFVLLFDFILVRSVYRSGWGDSGNRMLVHVLPLIFFYLTIKYYRGTAVSEADVSEFNRNLRWPVLATLGGLLLVGIIRYIQFLLFY
jgi:hypothetical protein